MQMTILIHRQARDPTNPDTWTHRGSERLGLDGNNPETEEYVETMFKDKMAHSSLLMKWEVYVYFFDFETQEMTFLFKKEGSRKPKRILNDH
jgi:hypothetical protein